jgi:hypothetical protein
MNMFVYEYRFVCWWKSMLYEISVIVYAYVVKKYCDDLFMMIDCVVWLKYQNDDMYAFMELIENLRIWMK